MLASIFGGALTFRTEGGGFAIAAVVVVLPGGIDRLVLVVVEGGSVGAETTVFPFEIAGGAFGGAVMRLPFGDAGGRLGGTIFIPLRDMPRFIVGGGGSGTPALCTPTARPTFAAVANIPSYSSR